MAENGNKKENSLLSPIFYSDVSSEKDKKFSHYPTPNLNFYIILEAYMDKIGLLKSQKDRLRQEGSETRKMISELIDADSFVELQSFGTSRNDFYGETALGEGVVTGYATIGDHPVYVVALMSNVLSGGLGLGNCKKIVNCMEKAQMADAPVVYLLSSQGILAGEGVDALEGVASLLNKANELKGVVPQFAVCKGKVLGQATVLAAQCDYVYYLKGACVCYGSPLVVAAKAGVSADEAKLCGSNNGNGLCTFDVNDVTEVRNGICDVLEVLPDFGGIYAETEDDANRNAPALNEKVCAKCLTEAVFDQGKLIELGKGYAPEVITGIGRVGGYSVATVIFNGENGVELTDRNVQKIKDFLYYASDNRLPVLTFVNTLGIKQDAKTNSSTVLNGIAQLLCALNYASEVPQINVIYGKAIGLGYTLFGSKAYGADYSFAFATSEIGACTKEVGAEMEYAVAGGNKEELKEKFASVELDPLKAAASGYIDDVIEPQFVRQYIISALQMLI